MIHPFLDSTPMTDIELDNKLQKLYGILAHQEYMGHTEMYNNVLQVIESLEMEQQKRASDAMIAEEIKNHKDLEFGDVTDELGIDYNDDE